MIKSAVTISLVPESRQGPFVFKDDLPWALEQAAALGFDAVELFFPAPGTVPLPELQTLLSNAGLAVAAVGTGVGMLRHQLSLVDTDPVRRQKACDFVVSMIRFGAEFEAPAIVGSMQGRWLPEVGRNETLTLLGESLHQLGQEASACHVPLLYEPLNRYESNLLNTQQESVDFLMNQNLQNVKLLADLFHMNIEETSIAGGLLAGGRHIGHVHFVDSNRRAAGFGHLDFEAVAAALKEIGYDHYLSAEAFAWPDSETTARQTIDQFRNYFRRDENADERAARERGIARQT